MRWTTNASDEQVMNLVREADVFLSFGREGYGIPVLEAIQLGTPVFFDGTQPAAELMQGHGAYKTSVDQAFQAPLPRSITREDQEHVPTWKNYARDIAHSLSKAQQEGSSGEMQLTNKSSHSKDTVGFLASFTN